MHNQGWLRFCLCVLATLGVAGGVDAKDRREKGPDGTVAYSVEIESSEPGARVEANDDYLGKTPITIKIFGDDDGTFHNFGSQDYVIRVFPVRAGQFVQTKAFRTGGWFSDEDKIPSRLYFDLDAKSERFTLP